MCKKIAAVCFIACMLVVTSACHNKSTKAPAPIPTPEIPAPNSSLETEKPLITTSSPSSEQASDSEPVEGDGSTINDEIYLQAMHKWETLGGNCDFKSIESIDTLTLLKVYSSYVVYNKRVDFDVPKIWLKTAEFDEFVKEYFNLSPDQLHQGDYFDSEKGFMLYSHTQIVPISNYQLTNFGENPDGTHSFEAIMTFEIPKELVQEGESIVERTISVSFQYTNETVYFTEASYYQNGAYL